MNKKGQGVFGMSFGMIFSIILIITIVGVAIFAINHFLGLSNCTKIGLAYQEMQEEVNDAWTSGIYRDTYGVELPEGLDNLCFGNITLVANGEDEIVRQKIDEFYFSDGSHNVFANPPQKACDGELAYYKLNHVDIEGFFCFDSSEVIVKLDKGTTDSLVRLSK